MGFNRVDIILYILRNEFNFLIGDVVDLVESDYLVFI